MRRSVIRSHRASQRLRSPVKWGSTDQVNRWDRDRLEERITRHLAAEENLSAEVKIRMDADGQGLKIADL